MENSQEGFTNLLLSAVIIFLVGVGGYLVISKESSPVGIDEATSSVEVEDLIVTKENLVFPEEGDELYEGTTYMVTIPGAESGTNFYLNSEGAGYIRIADTYAELSPWTVPSVLDYMKGGDNYHGQPAPEDGYRISYVSSDGSRQYGPTFKIISKK